MITNSKLQEAVEHSRSYRDVCKYLGVKYVGGTYRKVRNRILSLKLDTSHFAPFARFGRTPPNKRPLVEILVVDSDYGSSRLKPRLYKAGLKKEECEECGQESWWNGKPLVLQLDHINGVSDDNRLENLRILCPHCHSQTDTYVARNRGR